MQRIDLVSTCVKSKPERWGQVKYYGDFTGDEERIIYPYPDFHRQFGLNHEIIEKAAFGTYILDIGAGFTERFRQQQLRSKDLQVIGVDDSSRFLREESQHIMAKVRLDLEKIPYAIHNPSCSWLESLRTYNDSLTVPAMQLQIRSLINLFEKREIGTYIFSHLLLYLVPELQHHLLKLATLSLVKGGRIYIMDQGTHQLKTDINASGIQDLGFEQALRLCADGHLQLVKHEFWVPVVSPEQWEELNKLRRQISSRLFFYSIRERMQKGEFQFAKIDLQDNQEGINYKVFSSGEVALTAFGEVIMVLEK